MKKLTISLIISVFCFVFNVYPQTSDEHFKPSGTARKDLLHFLKPGKHIAGIIDVSWKKMTPRESALADKMKKAMQTNFFRSPDSAKYTSDSSIYYEKIGLTKDEFEEYTTLLKGRTSNRKITFTKHETLDIYRKGDLLTFMGTGSLTVLDSLRLNVERNVATYKNYQLFYSNVIGSEDSNSELGGPWSGYEYATSPLDQSAAAMPDPEKVTYTLMRLQVGYDETTHKTMLDFVSFNFENGRQVMNISIPILID